MLSRRAFLKWIGGLFTAGIGTAGYAGVVEPAFRLIVKTYQIQPPAWPRDKRLRIVALADPHMGEPHMPLSRLSYVVEKVNALKPDLIVLLGDYVAGHRFVTKGIAVRDTAKVCRNLSAPLGIYAILGNHDWWDDRTAQRTGKGPIIAHRAFEAEGIPVLHNDAIKLTRNGQAFWLLGLGDQWALARRGGYVGVDDLPGVMAKINDNDPAILLAHEPDIFPKVSPRVALTLSGHTHGGQVRIFRYSPIVPSRFGNRYAYGHIKEGNKHLVVSGGLGCSILPVRFGVPPEITVVELS